MPRLLPTLLCLVTLTGCLRDLREQPNIRRAERERLPEDRSGVAAWLVDRGADLADVVDLRVGYGLGLGARLELTHYVQFPAGLVFQKDGAGSYGRRWLRSSRGWASIIPIFGPIAGDDQDPRWGNDIDYSLFGVMMGAVSGNGGLFSQDTVDTLPLGIDRYRVGLDVHVLFAGLGVFLNTGEVLDLLGGLVGWDPALDDGLPLVDMGAPVKGSPAYARAQETGGG